jgi:triosephosphate isomerase
MRKKIVAANWKMNGSLAGVKALANAAADVQASCDIAVFPPFVFLASVEAILMNTNVYWGAQNVSSELSGAYTGEISASMLKEFGCRYVLVGHSERRQLFHETNEMIAKKFAVAQQQRLVPMLCIGETREERTAGKTSEVVLSQLDAIIDMAGVQALPGAVIAYEPVWAIGTGLTATPEQAQAVHAEIRSHIAQFDGKIAELVQILYGGSVKPENAATLFAMPDIDGALVGGASLDAGAFAKICMATG